MVDKYGEDAARAKNRRPPSIASKAGKGNTGKNKTPEHRRKISEAIKRRHAEKKLLN